MTDPGIQRAPIVKAQILNLLQMLVGNKAGGGSEPDWDSISGSRVGADAQSTGAYVRNALQVSKQALDPQKQFSADLIQAIDTCLPVRCLPTNDEPTATLSPNRSSTNCSLCPSPRMWETRQHFPNIALRWRLLSER